MVQPMRILPRAFLLGSVLVSTLSSAQQSPLNYTSRVDGTGSITPNPALAIGSNNRDPSTANVVPSTSQVLVPAVGELQEVTVTTSRLSLIGTATTASQGVVVNDEIALTPAYRPGQLLETVPGLEVTLHSGEGKANQYLMRGYNLDHGTDLATFVDGMPINEPTHAHGQGYTDLNFMIPALATNIEYTKGTYYADEGDFASVGSVHLSYLDSIDSQAAASSGTFGFEHFFTAGSTAAGSGHVLGALELQHYDGPWINPDDQRKINAVLRYSEGNGHDGYSVTGMFYHDLWNSSTDHRWPPQPVRLSRSVRRRSGTARQSLAAIPPHDRRRPIECERLRHQQSADPVEQLHSFSGRSGERRSGSTARGSSDRGGGNQLCARRVTGGLRE